MLNLLENIIDSLKNDATIQSFVEDRVFPQGVDIFPETTLLPLITVHNISEVTLSIPKGERVGIIQISIFSRLNQLEVEQIAERALIVLNFEQFNMGHNNAILRWQRQDSGIDMYESDRRIWVKHLSFRIWCKP